MNYFQLYLEDLEHAHSFIICHSFVLKHVSLFIFFGNVRRGPPVRSGQKTTEPSDLPAPVCGSRAASQEHVLTRDRRCFVTRFRLSSSVKKNTTVTKTRASRPHGVRVQCIRCLSHIIILCLRGRERARRYIGARPPS